MKVSAALAEVEGKGSGNKLRRQERAPWNSGKRKVKVASGRGRAGGRRRGRAPGEESRWVLGRAFKDRELRGSPRGSQ